MVKRTKLHHRIPANINFTPLTDIRILIHDIYKYVSSINEHEQQSYKLDTMKRFITKRCNNYKSDKHVMLVSALSKPQRRITLDKVLIGKGANS